MTINITRDNMEDTVDMFIASAIGCPQWVNPWLYLKKNPDRCSDAMAALFGLSTILSHQSNDFNTDSKVIGYVQDVILKVMSVGVEK